MTDVSMENVIPGRVGDLLHRLGITHVGVEMLARETVARVPPPWHDGRTAAQITTRRPGRIIMLRIARRGLLIGSLAAAATPALGQAWPNKR